MRSRCYDTSWLLSSAPTPVFNRSSMGWSFCCVRAFGFHVTSRRTDGDEFNFAGHAARAPLITSNQSTPPSSLRRKNEMEARRRFNRRVLEKQVWIGLLLCFSSTWDMPYTLLHAGFSFAYVRVLPTCTWMCCILQRLSNEQIKPRTVGVSLMFQHLRGRGAGRCASVVIAPLAVFYF